MTATPSLKRLSISITAAVASATLAIGVTAASLLGWFGPAPTAPAQPSPTETTRELPTQQQPAQENPTRADEIFVSRDDIAVTVHHDDDHEEHEHEDDDD